MQTRYSQCALALLIAAGSCAPVLAIQTAQPAAPAVEAAPADETLVAIIVAVQGKVEYQTAKDADWLPAETGQVIPVGGAVRTGLRSAIQLRISDTQVITVDRIGMVALDQVLRENGVNKTELGLKYGRVKFDVTSTKFANDVVIKARDATLAVKGTQGAMEVTGGHPTLAYGAPENRGRIVVEYGDGTAEIKDSSKSNSKTTDPAEYGDEEAFVDSGDGESRDEGESDAADRVPGGGGLVSGFLFDGFDPNEIAPEPGPGNWIAVADIESGKVLRFDLLNGRFREFADSPQEFDVGGLTIGEAVSEGKGKGKGRNPGGFSLYLLEGGNLAEGQDQESEAFNELYVANIGNGGRRGEPAEFTLLGKFTDAEDGETNLGGDILAGLGIVDGEFYSTNLASGFESSLDTIVRLDLETETYTDVMNFGQGFAARNLMGSQENGSLFVVGNLIDSSNAGPLARLTVLEFDPRNNYIADSFSGAAGDFSIRQGTLIGNGLDTTLFNSDSLDVQGITIVNGRIVLAVEGSNAEKGERTNAFITINPDAAGTGRNPYVSSVNRGRNRGLTGIGSAPRGRGRDAVVLDNPEGAIDTTTINALFATLAFSERSLRSGALQHMVGSEIINTAIDPAGCATSELIGMIPEAMLRHVNQTSGIGRTVAHLRDNLPDGHPCLPANGRRGG